MMPDWWAEHYTPIHDEPQNPRFIENEYGWCESITQSKEERKAWLTAFCAEVMGQENIRRDDEWNVWGV
jgi:hypothetical protein